MLAWAVRLDLAFKFHQLAHEVEVGGDGRTLLLDVLVGLLHGEPIVLHEVGDHQGHRARDSSHAVDEDTATRATHLFCACEKKEKGISHAYI